MFPSIYDQTRYFYVLCIVFVRPCKTNETLCCFLFALKQQPQGPSERDWWAKTRERPISFLDIIISQNLAILFYIKNVKLLTNL